MTTFLPWPGWPQRNPLRTYRIVPGRQGRARPRSAILHLEILEGRVLPSNTSLIAPPPAAPQYVLVHHGGNAAPLGSPSPPSLVPAQVRHAYGIDQVSFNNGTVVGDGTGQTIAIVDAYDDPNIQGDLQAFDQQFNLPNPIFTKVAQDGSTNYPPPNPGWITEIALDVEWAHAVAPGAGILLVEAKDSSFSNLNTAVDYARNQPGVVAVSMSYGSNEFSTETNFDFHFTTPSGHNGVTFLSASGDSGAPALYQATSPNVVGVGGTVLNLDASGNTVSETGWGSSGGGLSQFEAQPSYQAGVVTQSTTQRASPDVSILGGTAVSVYESYNNGSTKPWIGVYGTSVSTPCWAGLIAIADQGRALSNEGSLDGPTQTLPFLYQLPPDDFHDITSGNNGHAAGPGYDLVTGRGTPVANLLIPDLVHIPVSRTWTGAGPDANWSDPLNWAGGVAPSPGDVLLFGPGAAQSTNTDDFASGTMFNSIRFLGSGYTISGNDITLSGSINAGASTGTNVFNDNTTLGGNALINAGMAATSLTIGGNVNDAGYSVQLSGSGGSVIFNGSLSGSGGLTDLSAGTLLLAGNDTYSGGTTMGGTGVLSLGGNSVLGTGALVLNSGTIQANSSAVTVSNDVSLGGSVTFAGANNLTFTGPTTLTGNCTLTINNTATTTFAGGIGQSTTAALTKSGTGLLALSSTGTYAGGTTLSKGTLRVSDPGALGSGPLTLSGGTFQGGGAPLSLSNAVTLAGNVTIGGASDLTFTSLITLTGTRSLIVNNTGTTTFSSGIGQSVGLWGWSKSGNGLLVIAGASTYAGSTTLNGGPLQVNNSAALGSGTLTLVGGSLQAGGGPISLSNAVTLGGNVAIGGANDLTLTGLATLTGKRSLTISNTGTTTFSGGIGQSGGSFGLNKFGNGVLVLSGNDTYAGGTTLSAGTLQVNNAAALGSGTVLLVAGILQAGGGPLTLSNAVTLGGNVTIGGTNDLTFTGAATLTGNRTLTISNTGTTTFAGAIGQTAVSKLTKAGSGVLVLWGANTYTGGTVVASGALLVKGSLAAGTVTVASGATLGGSGTTGPIAVSAGGTVLPGTGATGTAILSTGSVTLASGAAFNVVLNDVTPGSGYDQLNVTGTVNLAGSTLKVTLGFTPPIGTAFTLINNDGTDPVVGTFQGLPERATLVINSMTFQISYVGGTGNDVVLTRIA
jgi:autotransporter-associated beta strand protein